MKYICEICGYIYDEEKGDPKHGVPAGTAFADLPAYYGCAACGADKDTFNKAEKAPTLPKKDTSEFWKGAKYSDAPGDSQR